MKATHAAGMQQALNGNGKNLSAMIAGILKTRETRSLVADVVPEILETWAGENRMKKIVAARFDGLIRKKMNGAHPGGGLSLMDLMKDASFTSSAARFLPTVLNVLVDSLNAVTVALETATDAERERFLAELTNGLGQSKLGDSLTVVLKSLNRSYQENPRYLSEKLGPMLVTWLEGLDFGEIRDFMDLSADDMQRLVAAVVETLWKYPSKLVLILGFAADLVNATSTASADVLAMINKISPDLLTDVFFSIFRNIDGKSIGRMLNEISELVRKVHTGSALLGEPGTTQLPVDLTRFLEDVLSVLDGELMWKAKVAFEEEKQNVTRVFYQVMKENPERLERRMIHYASLKNSQIGSLLHRISTITQLPEKAVADAAEKSLSPLETQDLAEVVNLYILLINRIGRLKPSLIPGLVSQFVDGLDLYEANEGLALLLESTVDARIPLERVLVPKLVKLVCRALEPRDDDYEEEAAEARAMLRSLLMDEEVKS